MKDFLHFFIKLIFIIVCTVIGLMFGFVFSEAIRYLPSFLEELLWEYDDTIPFVCGIIGFFLGIFFIVVLNDVYKKFESLERAYDSVENRIMNLEKRFGNSLNDSKK